MGIQRNRIVYIYTHTRIASGVEFLSFRSSCRASKFSRSNASNFQPRPIPETKLPPSLSLLVCLSVCLLCFVGLKVVPLLSYLFSEAFAPLFHEILVTQPLCYASLLMLLARTKGPARIHFSALSSSNLFFFFFIIHLHLHNVIGRRTEVYVYETRERKKKLPTVVLILFLVFAIYITSSMIVVKRKKKKENK